VTEYDQQRLWHLVLEYEELEPAERQALDEALKEAPHLTRDWNRLREIETRAACDWPLAADEFWQTAAGNPDCQQSLARILDELPNPAENTLPFARRSADGPIPATSRRRFFSPRVLWPLAAVLALAVFWSSFAPQKDLIGPLTVQTIQITDSGTRSLPTPLPAAGQLRTGQAFVLSLTPETNGWLVVYHVDPAGRRERVFAGEISRPDGDLNTVTVPSVASGDYWVLSGDPGKESFVIGAAADPVVDLADLDRTVTAGYPVTGDHEQAVTAVSSALAHVVTTVRVLTVEHIE